MNLSETYRIQESCEKPMIKKKRIIILLSIVIIISIVLLVIKSQVINIGEKKYFRYSTKINYCKTVSLTSEDIINLQKMTNLQEMDIQSYQLDDLSFLKGKNKLQKIKLLNFHNKNHNLLNTPDLNYLFFCRNLEDIELWFCHMDNLNAFSNFDHLKRLSLVGEYEKLDFSQFHSDSLEELTLNCMDISDFNGIENIINLKKICIENTFEIPDKQIDSTKYVDVSAISKLEKLEDLTIIDFPCKIDVSKICNKSLKKICIRFFDSEDVSTEWINTFPLLEELDIVETKIENIGKLCNNKTLKTIILSEDMYTQEELDCLKSNGIQIKYL